MLPSRHLLCLWVEDFERLLPDEESHEAAFLEYARDKKEAQKLVNAKEDMETKMKPHENTLTEHGEWHAVVSLTHRVQEIMLNYAIVANLRSPILQGACSAAPAALAHLYTATGRGRSPSARAEHVIA